MADHTGAGINTVNTKPRVVSHISKLSINEVNEVNEVKESSSADSSPDSASSATAPESLLQTSSAVDIVIFQIKKQFDLPIGWDSLGFFGISSNF